MTVINVFQNLFWHGFNLDICTTLIILVLQIQLSKVIF